MRVQNDVRVTFRVDKDLKEQSENLFDRLGLNMTAALNAFLRKAVDESAIPFPVSTKSSNMVAGHSPADITRAFETAVQGDIAENSSKGAPVARYDSETKRAYLESADGTREYING